MNDAGPRSSSELGGSSRPLRILALTLRYPPYVRGGYELLTRDAVEALRARGHRVQVLVGRGQKYSPEAGVIASLEPALDGAEDLFERSFRASNPERFALHFYRHANYRATLRALDATQADALFFFNLSLVSLAPLLAARHREIPTLGFVSDPWPLNHWLLAWSSPREDGTVRKMLLRAYLERAWRSFRELVGLGPLLVASHHLAGRLAEGGVPREELDVVHLGVSPDLAQLAERVPIRVRAPGEALRVVCLSSYWKGKGQDVLLAALALARDRAARIECVFAGAEENALFRSELEAEARARGLSSAVDFCSALDRGGVSELLAKCHVLVLPSVWQEPFSLAVLEGMVHGLAIVVSDRGGSPEALEHLVSGWIVAAGDASALAQALERLAGDESLRLRLARAARERARSAFNHAAFIDRLEQGLFRVVGRRA